MTQPFYTAQTDVAVGTRGKATDINNLDSAVEQGFKNAHAYGIDSGTSAAYVVTMDTDATAYYDGMVVSFAPDNTNSVQSPTINVNGLGAKATSSANQLSGVVEIGEIKTGYVYTFVYYSTGFVLQGSARLNTIPGPIGSGTPSTGAFTTLSASSTVSGAGFTARFAAPGPIGSVTPSTGSFTTVLATSALDFQGASASGLYMNLANETAGAGAFCALLLTNDDNDQTQFRQTSSTFTPVGVFGARTGGLAGSAVAIGASGAFEIGVGALYPLTFQFSATLNRSYLPMNYRGGDNASATNSAFGEGALDSNSGGTDNTAAGNNALTANSSASYNTAFGSGALVAVTTGPRNTAIGYRAGYAVGTGALENTFIGASTGLDLAAANIQSCVMVGYAAGSGLTGGNENTFVGTQAGVNPGGSYSNVTVVGKSAEATASNQVVLGNSSVTEATTFGKLQILSGTAVPAGGTAGAGLRFSTTANLGVFFGSGAPSLAAAKGSLYLRTDGSTTNNRMYVNTDGGTTWTAVTTAA